MGTEINTRQIKDSTIRREDIDITTGGSSLITKVLAGKNLEIAISTGADLGTGDVTLRTSATPEFDTISVTSNSLVENLNADLLDGNEASAFSFTSHNHDSVYASRQDGARNSTDFNTILSSGFYNAEGAPPNAPAPYGQLIVAKGIDTGLQIYGGYENNNLWFRGWGYGPNEGFYPWRKIWHDGNMGHTTGLDADLWDGYQFADFLNQSVKSNSSPTFVNVRATDGISAAGYITSGNADRSGYSAWMRGTSSYEGFAIGVNSHTLISSGDYFWGDHLYFWTADAKRMMIDHDGSIHILDKTNQISRVKFSTEQSTYPYVFAYNVAGENTLLQIPNGLYVSAGYAYFENKILARNGIKNDVGAYLTIDGGTSGHTYFAGSIGILTSTPAAPLDVAGDVVIGKNEAVDHQLKLFTGANNNTEIWFYPYSDYGFRLGNYGPQGAKYFQLKNNNGDAVISVGPNNTKDATFASQVSATNIFPISGSVYNLGFDYQRWASVFAINGNFTGVVYGNDVSLTNTLFVSSASAPYVDKDYIKLSAEDYWHLKVQSYHYGNGYDYKITSFTDSTNTNALTFNHLGYISIDNTAGLKIKTDSAGFAIIRSDANGAIYSANGDVQIHTNNAAYTINFYSANKGALIGQISNNGNTYFAGTVNVSGSNGFAIGGVAGRRRIQFEADAFTFLTDGDGYANVKATWFNGVNGFGVNGTTVIDGSRDIVNVNNATAKFLHASDTTETKLRFTNTNTSGKSFDWIIGVDGTYGSNAYINHLILFNRTNNVEMMRFDTTANNPSITFTGSLYNGSSLIWNAGNDGAGSGLDADLLDGFNTSQNGGGDKVLVTAGNGYLFLDNWLRLASNTGLFYSSGVHFYESNVGMYCTHSISSAPQGTLWGSSNDGSGSGLDADLWDGEHFANWLNQPVGTGNQVTFNQVTSQLFLSPSGITQFKSTGDQTNSCILPDTTQVAQSPVPLYLWHDLAAFCKIYSTIEETSTNGTDWSSVTLTKDLFAGKEAQSIIALDTADNINGRRWRFSDTSWSQISYILLGTAWDSPVPVYDLIIETGVDQGPDITWTVASTNRWQHAAIPIWLYISAIGATKYLRLTLKVVSGTGKLRLSNIKLLSFRHGDQGYGSEYSYPYTWDKDQNVDFNGTIKQGGTQVSLVGHTHNYEPANANIQSHISSTHVGLDGANAYGTWAISISGTAANATNAVNSVYTTWLNANTVLSYGANGLNYFNQSTAVSSGASVNANPTNSWYHIIRMNHGNPAGYFVDLAFHFHDYSAYYRVITGGTELGWVRLIDSANISSQTVSHASTVTTLTKAQIESALTGTITSHDHSGTYEPLISKANGYAKMTDGVWSFANESYSLSNHGHDFFNSINVQTSAGNAVTNSPVSASGATAFTIKASTNIELSVEMIGSAIKIATVASPSFTNLITSGYINSTGYIESAAGFRSNGSNGMTGTVSIKDYDAVTHVFEIDGGLIINHYTE